MPGNGAKAEPYKSMTIDRYAGARLPPWSEMQMIVDPKPPTTLRISGILILLAVLTLAGVGFHSLRQDRRQILAEAQSEARSIASRITADVKALITAAAPMSGVLTNGGRLALTIGKIEHPFLLQDDRAIPAIAAQAERPAQSPPGRTKPFTLFLPNQQPQDHPFCVVSKSNTLLHPPPVSESGRHTTSAQVIPNDLRDEWEAAIALLHAPPSDAKVAVDRFQGLEATVPERMLPLVKYHHGLALARSGRETAAVEKLTDCARTSRRLKSETGTPLALLARFHIARILMNGETRDGEKGLAIMDLAWAAVNHPSDLTPRFLKQAAA